MIDKFLDGGAKYVRNPLGVIGLFIALIYGAAALLVGTTASVLNVDQVWALVGFIVAFPVLVLGVFFSLVVWHHQNLYAPQDFRSDEGFLRNSAPNRLGERLEEDALELDHDDVGAEQDVADPGAVAPVAPRRQNRLADLFVAESLAIQELELRHHLNFRRNVAVEIANQSLELDGVADDSRAVHIAEIYAVGEGGIHALRSPAKVARLHRVISAGRALALGRDVKVLLTVVLKKRVAEKARRKRELMHWLSQNGLSNVSVEIFELEELLLRYGLSS
ncbi:MAG: hypothetical protein AB7I36_07250 [Rhodospirillaceae bacterium]